MKSLVPLLVSGALAAGCSKSNSEKPILRRRPDAGGAVAAVVPAATAEPARQVAGPGPAILKASVKSSDGTTCEATIDDDCRQCIARLSDASILDACESLQGKATAGPAAGQPLAQLCRETLDCIHRTKCHANNLLDCYCGTAIDQGTCYSTKTEAAGACKKEFDRSLQAAPGSAGLDVLRLITEKDEAGGVAGIIATFENTPCASVCVPYEATACK